MMSLSFSSWPVIGWTLPLLLLHLLSRTALLHEKVKWPHYRPWQAIRVPGSWGFQILRWSAHEGGKVVSPMHRLPLPREIFLVLISVRGWVNPRARVQPEGVCQWKIPMTLSGINPVTYRFVAQCICNGNVWYFITLKFEIIFYSLFIQK
jgi:hypothetical protein